MLNKFAILQEDDSYDSKEINSEREDCLGEKSQYHMAVNIIWASMQGNRSSKFANNEGTDQPAHPCSLISAFVIRLLESIISKLATRENSIF